MSRLSQTMRIDIPPDLKEEWRHGDRRPRSPGQTDAAAESASGSTPAADRHIGNADFRQLFQSVYDGAIIAHLDGTIADANTRTCDFFQMSLAELRRLNLTALISGADAATIHTIETNVDDNRFVLVQAYCTRKDGSLFPVEIAINRLRSGKKSFFCCFVRDVTLRRQAEEMLRTVHNAIQNATTGIAITGLDGVLTYVNQASVRLLNEPRTGSLVGRNIRDLLPDMAQTETMIATVLSGKTWTGEVVLPGKEGGSRYLQVSVTDNRDTDEELVGMAFSFLDIGDRKRAEEAEKQAERQRVMMESIGTACHHLGQPATVLLASLELLTRKRDANPETTNELLASCMEAAESLRTMLHKLNNIAAYRPKPYMTGQPSPGEAAPRILSVEHGDAP